VLAQRGVSVKAGKTLTARVKLSAAGRHALRNRTTRVTVSLRKQGTKVNVSVQG
jgi:methyl coenzyme M reductase subunit C